MARLIQKIEYLIGATLLLVIVGLVFVAAIMRFFGHPLIWSVDIAQLLLIWLCFFGAVRAMRERAHLGVDLFVRALSPKIRLWIETVMALVFIAFMAVLAREGYALTMLNRERIFQDSGISYAFVTIAVPAGCVMLSLVIIANLISAWKQRGEGEALVFTRANTDTAIHEEI